MASANDSGAGVARSQGWLTQASDAVLGAERSGPLLRLFGVLLLIVLAFPLVLTLIGLFLPGSIDGGATLSLPPPPPITQAERDALRKAEPAFDEGLPPPAIRVWPLATLPKGGVFAAPTLASTATLEAAIGRIRDAAQAVAQGEPAPLSTLAEAREELQSVPKSKGKPAVVTLYHLALASLLESDPTPNVADPLNQALDAIKQALGDNPSALEARRAAGARAAIYYAQGEVELRDKRFAEARKSFDQAIAAADAARGGDGGGALFKLDPAAAVADYDTGQLLAEDLRAAQRADDVAAIDSDLRRLGQQTADSWAGRSQLAVDAQLIAADRGLWSDVSGIAVQWAADDPTTWQTLSAEARYIGDPAYAGPAPAALKDVGDVRNARATLASANTLTAVRSALSHGAFAGQAPIAQAWRDEVSRRIGQALLNQGLDGSQTRADTFILEAGDVFPFDQKWEAASRRMEFGLSWPFRLALQIPLLALLAVAFIFLHGARRSYRLTFATHHYASRASRAG